MRLSRNPARRILGWAIWGLWLDALMIDNPLGRQHPLGTLARLWTWQLWRRTVARPVVVTLPEGSQLVCPPWSSMASAWISVGFHEYDEMLFALDLVREGELFVDVGANLGIYSMVMANRGCRVMAFEPNPAVAPILRHNAALNQQGRVTIYQNAVGDKTGEVTFSGPTDSQGRLFQDGPGASTVAMTSLDNMLTDEVPTLIKIDAEGYDGLVMKGGEAVIQRCQPVVITEVFAGSPENRNWLEYHGYRVYGYSPTVRELHELPRDFDSQGSFIAVHDEQLEAVKGRLTSSVRPRLHQPHVRWRPGHLARA